VLQLIKRDVQINNPSTLQHCMMLKVFLEDRRINPFYLPNTSVSRLHWIAGPKGNNNHKQ
jgi:hypothetical protein